MKSEDEVTRAYMLYKDDLKHIALLYLRNVADANDVIQNTYTSYMLKSPTFNDVEHEKKWLRRVCINECRTLRRSWWHKRVLANNANAEVEIGKLVVQDKTLNDISERELIILEELSKLPDKYKKPLILSCKGYTSKEIAEILRLNENTVKTQLKRAKEMIQSRINFGGGDSYV